MSDSFEIFNTISRLLEVRFILQTLYFAIMINKKLFLIVLIIFLLVFVVSQQNNVRRYNGQMTDLDGTIIRLRYLQIWKAQNNHGFLIRYVIYIILVSYGSSGFGGEKVFVSVLVRSRIKDAIRCNGIKCGITLVVMCNQGFIGVGIEGKKETVIEIKNLKDLSDAYFFIWYRGFYWIKGILSLVALLYIEIVLQRFFISFLISIISILKVLTYFFALGFIMSQGQWLVRGKER